MNGQQSVRKQPDPATEDAPTARAVADSYGLPGLRIDASRRCASLPPKTAFAWMSPALIGAQWTTMPVLTHDPDSEDRTISFKV